MGAFILIAVILFPYYQQNARILQELKEAKAAHAAAVAERDQAVAERDRLREEARRAQDEARAARERQAEAEARLRQLEKERPQKTPEPQTAGARSAWRYGNLEFVMYEYPGRQPGTQLVVGIVTRIHGSSTARIGDVALLGIRNGASLTGDLWAFASRPTCFLNTMPMKFQAQFGPGDRSLNVSRQTATLSGGGSQCILRSDGTKSFVMNRIN
jgi:hypothetical protein